MKKNNNRHGWSAFIGVVVLFIAYGIFLLIIFPEANHLKAAFFAYLLPFVIAGCFASWRKIRSHAAVVSPSHATREELKKTIVDLGHERFMRWAMEEKVAQAKNEWVKTFNAMFDWVCLIDMDLTILRANQRGEQIVGIPATEMIGKKCCSIIHGTDSPIEACPLPEMVRTGQRASVELEMPDGRWLMISIDPVMDNEGKIISAVHIVRDISQRRSVEIEKEQLIDKLQTANQKIKVLSGLVPICSICKKIRDDKGCWNILECYIQERSEAEFTHSICPDCARIHYPDLHLTEEK